MIQAAPARNRGGQGERPKSLAPKCSGRQAKNSKTSPATRSIARRGDGRCLGLAAAVESDAVELHALVDEPEAKLLGDPALQRLQLFIDELDDIAGLDVD